MTLCRPLWMKQKASQPWCPLKQRGFILVAHFSPARPSNSVAHMLCEESQILSSRKLSTPLSNQASESLYRPSPICTTSSSSVHQGKTRQCKLAFRFMQPKRLQIQVQSKCQQMYLYRYQVGIDWCGLYSTRNVPSVKKIWSIFAVCYLTVYL